MSNPVDVISTRLCNQEVDSDTHKGSTYKGIADCAIKMYKTEGIYGFYKVALFLIDSIVRWVLTVNFEPIGRTGIHGFGHQERSSHDAGSVLLAGIAKEIYGILQRPPKEWPVQTRIVLAMRQWPKWLVFIHMEINFLHTNKCARLDIVGGGISRLNL